MAIRSDVLVAVWSAFQGVPPLYISPESKRGVVDIMATSRKWSLL